MQLKKSPAIIGLLLSASMIMTGCESIRSSSSELSPVSQNDIRTAALRFTDAVRRDDVDHLRDLTLVSESKPCQAIEGEVLSNTITSHTLQTTLTRKFGHDEENPAIAGSAAWMNQYETVAQSSPIQRAGDRAHIGEAGKPGGFFLCNADGAWKVELISTFVAEAHGRQELSDPAVLYRLGARQAVNQWLLTRLNDNELHSVDDYVAAHDLFWVNYLGCTLSGKDPRNVLLASLPPLPGNDQLADNR